MKTNQNEELQSRREFFKAAAKAALPVIGAVVLSQLPIDAEAATDCGCNNRCMNSCWNGCYQSCKARCQNECHYNSK